MRRSLLEFHRALPDAAIIAHPVFPTGFRLAEWWRWPGTLSLLAERRAKKLFVSGVARDVDLDQLLKVSMRQDARNLRDRIALGHEAGDTQGNAHETADWMAKEGFASLRLVTASYHMRRSLLEFRHAMPHATMIPHPVFPEGFRGGEWWRWPGTLNLLISEYSKFLAALLRHVLGITSAPAGGGAASPAAAR